MDLIKWTIDDIYTTTKRSASSDHPVKRQKLFKMPDKMIYNINTEIHFTEDINKESIESIIKMITKIINKNDQKYRGGNNKLKITYIVDSPGGSVTAILKFVDFISLAKKKYPYVEFTSIITGLVASAGTIMCVVADHRYMTPYAHAMIHELSSGTQGKFTHMMSYGTFLTDLHNNLVDIYLRKCKKTKDELEDLLKKETWYSAKDYLEAGFVDKIIEV